MQNKSNILSKHNNTLYATKISSDSNKKELGTYYFKKVIGRGTSGVELFADSKGEEWYIKPIAPQLLSPEINKVILKGSAKSFLIDSIKQEEKHEILLEQARILFNEIHQNTIFEAKKDMTYHTCSKKDFLDNTYFTDDVINTLITTFTEQALESISDDSLDEDEKLLLWLKNKLIERLGLPAEDDASLQKHYRNALAKTWSIALDDDIALLEKFNIEREQTEEAKTNDEIEQELKEYIILKIEEATTQELFEQGEILFEKANKHSFNHSEHKIETTKTKEETWHSFISQDTEALKILLTPKAAHSLQVKEETENVVEEWLEQLLTQKKAILNPSGNIIAQYTPSEDEITQYFKEEFIQGNISKNTTNNAIFETQKITVREGNLTRDDTVYAAGRGKLALNNAKIIAARYAATNEIINLIANGNKNDTERCTPKIDVLLLGGKIYIATKAVKNARDAAHCTSTSTHPAPEFLNDKNDITSIKEEYSGARIANLRPELNAYLLETNNGSKEIPFKQGNVTINGHPYPLKNFFPLCIASLFTGNKDLHPGNILITQDDKNRQLFTQFFDVKYFDSNVMGNATEVLEYFLHNESYDFFLDDILISGKNIPQNKLGMHFIKNECLPKKLEVSVLSQLLTSANFPISAELLSEDSYQEILHTIDFLSRPKTIKKINAIYQSWFEKLGVESQTNTFGDVVLTSLQNATEARANVMKEKAGIILCQQENETNRENTSNENTIKSTKKPTNIVNKVFERVKNQNNGASKDYGSLAPHHPNIQQLLKRKSELTNFQEIIFRTTNGSINRT